eukprot:5228017-Lingulodinium_polyedra.AAC.1
MLRRRVAVLSQLAAPPRRGGPVAMRLRPVSRPGGRPTPFSPWDGVVGFPRDGPIAGAVGRCCGSQM